MKSPKLCGFERFGSIRAFNLFFTGGGFSLSEEHGFKVGEVRDGMWRDRFTTRRSARYPWIHDKITIQHAQ